MITAANGSFKDNIIIREHDDTYIFIKNRDVKLISSDGFAEFNRIVEENPCKNIIIDGRLENVLYYAILLYKDNILAYNIGEKRVSTIYSYLANIYKIPLSALTVNGICQWAMIMYINNIILQGILKLHTGDVLKYIVSNNCSGNSLTFNRIIDNIDGTVSGTVNKKSIKEIHEYMLSMINRFNERDYIVIPLKQKLLNAYHIRVTLEVLYSNRFVINL